MPLDKQASMGAVRGTAITMSIEDRLAQLERCNRRWRTGCIALLMLLGMGLLIAAERGSAPLEIVQARRFEVIGADGKAAIVLEAKPDATNIVVFGPDHEHAAILTAEAGKSALMLMKDKNTSEVFAEAVDHGGEIGIGDGRSSPDGDHAAMNLSGGPNGFSIFHAVNGKPESRLSFSKLGGGLELRTPGSKAVTRVIGADRGSRVEIDDAEGKLAWSAPGVNKQ
jgi:hypothetical protein